MAQQPEAHPRHNEQEYIVAAIGGAGLLLAILAGMLSAMGSSDDFYGMSYTNLLMVGGLLIAISLALWLIALRPWQNFDDLKTPYYTGHHDHHDADDHAAPIQAAADAPADDLELIEGIGPKVKAALIEAGITTFAQLAATHPDDLPQILTDADLNTNLLPHDTWPRQAQYIVDGDAHGFEGYKKIIVKGAEALEMVDGIGPKVKSLLIAAGIRTLAQLAATEVDQLRQILEDAKLPYIDPSSWPQQATFLADGDVSGFEAFVADLKNND